MTDHDEQWLRDGLAAAVPEPPGNPARAAEAANLADRRRRTTIAVAGAVAGVVVIAGIGAVIGSGPSPTPDGPPADSGSADQGQCPPAARMPRAPGFFDEPNPDLPAEVPEGAQWVRLCAGNGNRLDVPSDALTRGVDRLTEAVNDIPEPVEDYGCTEELGYGYRLVFGGYRDRPDFVVSGALYGCGFVTIGSEQRPGAEQLLRTFGALLREERSTRTGDTQLSTSTAAIPCDQPTTPAVAQPADIEVAVLCVRTARAWRRTDVSADDVAVLRQDLRHRVGNYGMPRCASSREVSLVGLTRWGERITLLPLCDISWFSVPEPWGTASWGASWRPGDEAVEILDELVSEARPAR